MTSAKSQVCKTDPEPMKFSPYPGLRPFQAEDSEYFFGRDAQVREVVARLREKRFVAVIGGSGSGKSSLVLAGAIPRLRTFAIKEAGDFWVPIVSTPGTNHVEGDSPLRRLAGKFCGELVDSDLAQDRLEECVDLLRKENGLGKLVERFGKDLKNPDGVDLTRPEVQVNFLFLIDQFEELFHPSNVGKSTADDCKRLVNRIIEQFKNPHSQVCVALTMRSEHLNDCPRYSDLPDAINAAAYLVKRLDGEQLRQAIEQPALRFLQKRVAEERNARRLARQSGQEPSAQKWPDDIPFEAALIRRLLKDSDEVLEQQDHADHLPLLQHLLFWIWAAASARCKDAPIPDGLKLMDLCVAIRPEGGADSDSVVDFHNGLEACLENRCEAIFSSDPDRQAAWETVFCSLSFKEPNTGTYTQARMGMTELRKRLNLGLNGDEPLESNLLPWLKPHRYLHWDTDSRTVKVAHETLIRRWERFRRWTDEEDRQFQVYIRLLEDCDRWEEASRADDYLSTGEMLRRYEDAELPEALQDPARVERFARLRAMDRDGQRLSAAALVALEFLKKSRENQDKRAQAREQAVEQQRADREQAAQARRDADVERARIVAVQAEVKAAQEKTKRVRNGRWWLTAFLAILTLFAFAEYFLAMKERTSHRSYTLAAATRLSFQSQFHDFDEMQLPLRNTLVGAHFFDVSRNLWTGPADWAFLKFSYQGRLQSLQNSEMFSEAQLNATLREVLLGAPWKISSRGLKFVKPMASTGCDHVSKKEDGTNMTSEVKGARFYSRPSTTDGTGLVVARDDLSNTLSVYSGAVKHVGKTIECQVETLLISTPPATRLQPVKVGVPADLSNLILAFSGYSQFHAILWDDPNGVQTRFRAVVFNNLQNTLFPNEESIIDLESARSTFATDVKAGDSTFRLFDLEPTRIDFETAKAGATLTKANDENLCGKFIKSHYTDIQTEEVWELSTQSAQDRTYCLHITSVSNRKGSSFLATLYGFGNEPLTNEKEAAERYLPLLGGLILGQERPTEYRMDTKSGWLAFATKTGQWRAVPWSVDAWRGLAQEVFAPGKADENMANGQQFRPAYRLILGEVREPTDEVLKSEVHLLPSRPERKASVENFEKK